MAAVEDVISQLADAHPGRRAFITELATLLATTAPSCIHVHAPLSPRPIAYLIRSILEKTSVPFAWLHGVECLSPRLVFDRSLHALSDWRVQWEEGCESFGAGKYNSDFDAFVQGLRAVARAKAHGEKLVLVVERAERFKENLPELMVPLTRLAELSGLPVTTMFLSEISWLDLRPPLGAAPIPFLMDVPNLNKEDTISSLILLFPTPASPTSHIGPYSVTLKPLYAQYAATLHSVCAPFLSDFHELAYLAAACWPVFVAPLLADWHVQASLSAAQGGDDEPMDQDPPSFTLPSEEARMRLIRYFSPTFTRALETLYPREQHADQWARENAPPPGLRLSELSLRGGLDARTQNMREEVKPVLTTVAKYVLVASFLASFNPAKADARMVGRAPDERRKNRRGGPRKSRGGGPARVPQRLLGPAAFPLDRLLAIVGSLMEEHDDGVPTLNSARGTDEDEDDFEREKDTELAVGRIQVSATISELVAMRLLHRTTPADRLDAPPAFKCGVSQAHAFEMARELGIGSLADFMWDPN